MSDGTKIEWTDATWNPVRGCSRVSAGCDNCYAIGVAHRFRFDGGELTTIRKDRADWSGKVVCVSEKLSEPLRWRKPRRIFVCSGADLFHPKVPFEFIAAVFGVMAACRRHTFQLLTKRPERMRAFFDFILEEGPRGYTYSSVTKSVSISWAHKILSAIEHSPSPLLPHVWLGTSVEDQATADKRIPELLACPGSLHWASYEPALGPVDFSPWMDHQSRISPFLRWIVVGGESGPGARPFELAYARRVLDDAGRAYFSYGGQTLCRVFVKQLGARPTIEGKRLHLKHVKGADMSEWPAFCRFRDWPEEA